MVSVFVVDAKLGFCVESAGVSRQVVVHGVDAEVMSNMLCSAHACGSVNDAIEDTSAAHCWGSWGSSARVRCVHSLGMQRGVRPKRPRSGSLSVTYVVMWRRDRARTVWRGSVTPTAILVRPAAKPGCAPYVFHGTAAAQSRGRAWLGVETRSLLCL